MEKEITNVEDFTIARFFHTILLSQTKEGVMNHIYIENVGDCDSLIVALMKIKEDELLILKGLENNGQ